MGKNRTGVFSMKNRTKYAKTVLVGMSDFTPAKTRGDFSSLNNFLLPLDIQWCALTMYTLYWKHIFTHMPLKIGSPPVMSYYNSC